jgi:hypothetical protein
MNVILDLCIDPNGVGVSLSPYERIKSVATKLASP